MQLTFANLNKFHSLHPLNPTAMQEVSTENTSWICVVPLPTSLDHYVFCVPNNMADRGRPQCSTFSMKDLDISSYDE